MWRYLKSALFVRPNVPGLGNVPVGVLSTAAFAILGVVHPAFWLIGLGVVGGFTFALAGSRRFQKLVDSRVTSRRAVDALAKRAQLVAGLVPESRERLANLQRRCERILTAHREAGSEPVVIDAARDGLDRMQWLYLKLLMARRAMVGEDIDETEKELRADIASIERELRSEKLAPSLRESRQATRELLGRRLERLAQRRDSIVEIDSDLARIEAQVDLSLDEATVQGRPAAISTNIELVSRMLDPGLFGVSSATVADIDEALGGRESE